MITSRTVVAVAATALFAAGCSGSDGSGGAVSTISATQTSSGIPQLSDQQAPPNRLVVDVTIAGDEVTPTNAQLQASVGDPIIIRVDSDAADELHAHSNPEHTFQVQPRNNQSFQFTATQPGRFDVELHELNRTIATIAVQ